MAGRLHPQFRVHARHHHVEPGEQLLVLVERPVLEDVDLDAGEDVERRQLHVQVRDDLELLAQALGISPCATVSRGLWSVSPSSRAPGRGASAISRMGLPPSDQSEWLWQSPCRLARIAAAFLLIAGGGVASSDCRYEGLSPASASAITWAVVLPTCGISCSLAAGMWASSSGAMAAMAAAALRKARTL